LQKEEYVRTMMSDRSWTGQAWVGTAIIVALVVGGLLGTSFATRTEAAAQPTVTFTGESAVMMNFVDPGKTDDYERVMQAYGQALRESDNAQYNQLASGLRIFRAAEPGQNNTVLYMWFVDSVVSGGNYAVAQVLNDEVAPGPPGNGAEMQGLYEAYIEALEGGGQQPINMTLMMEF
jgi:hypothetical protein